MQSLQVENAALTQAEFAILEDVRRRTGSSGEGGGLAARPMARVAISARRRGRDPGKRRAATDAPQPLPATD